MGRWNTVGHRCWMVVAVLAVVAAVAGPLSQSARAQNPPKAEAWRAVVDADRLNIHSGRAEQFEKIATLKRGDVVLVKSVNTFGWAAIAPPMGLHGFVAKQDVADTNTPGAVRAIGRVPVLYPISEDPAQCFRKSRVDPDTILKVLGEVPTADNTVYLKVEMPEQVDVYVLAQFLRKASDEEVAAWEKRMTEQAAAAEPKTPAASPSVEPTPQAVKQPKPKVEPPVEQKPALVKEPEPEAEPVTQPPVEQTKPKPTPAAEQPEQEPAQAPVDAKSESAAPPANERAAPVEEPEEPIVATLPNLEQLYTELVKVPILEAEVEPLLKSYEGFAAGTEKEGERRVAEIRISLLEIRLDQQNAMRKLKRAAEAANQPAVTTKVEIWRDENDRPVFTARGRLASSNVFDGRRLPLLYRIQDDVTGRTVAYLSVDPKDRLEVERRLNLNVGVVGETVHDPGLRIDVVNLKRIVDLDDGE